MLYYKHCERIWGGPPASKQIDAGLKSTDIGVAKSVPTIPSNEDSEEEDVQRE